LAKLQDQSDRLKRAFLMATEYAAMAAFPAMIGLSLVAPFVVEVFFGAKWLPAAPIVSILALSGCFTLALAVVPSALQAAGRPDLHMRWGMISVVLYLPAFAIGLRWGIVGVATGYLIVTMILAPVQFHLIARVINLTARDLLRVLWPAIVGSAVMGACVGAGRAALVAAGASKPVILVVLVSLGVIVYVGTLLVVKRDALRNMTRLVRDMRPQPTDRILQTHAPMVDRADG
jgi:PST family polysaccharide transporter